MTFVPLSRSARGLLEESNLLHVVLLDRVNEQEFYSKFLPRYHAVKQSSQRSRVAAIREDDQPPNLLISRDPGTQPIGYDLNQHVQPQALLE